MAKWLAVKGHDVSIITDVPQGVDGVEVYDIRKKRDLRPRYQRFKELSINAQWKWACKLNEIIRVRKLVDEIRPDIIHSHSLWYPGYLGAYITGYPYVLTVLNGDVLWKKDDVGLYTSIRTKYGVRKADAIMGVSQSLIDACKGHGASAKRTHVMRRGVDLNIFNVDYDRAKRRGELNLPEDKYIILSPRNTGSFYNLNNIVKAIPAVKARMKNVVFVFIWHGNDPAKEAELKSLASSLGVEDSIKIVGYVDHETVARYHQASDVMVSISSKDSGPVALQEAMACGNIPVISDLSSVRELMSDGLNGKLVDPDNIVQISKSIIELLEDANLRTDMAKRNWEYMKANGDQNYWMGKLEEMYYSIVSADDKSKNY